MTEFGFTAWEDIYELVNSQSGKQVLATEFRLIKDRDLLILSPLKLYSDDQEYRIESIQSKVNFPLNIDFSVVDAMDQFHKFAWGCSAFWSHGATFDLTMLENVYSQLNKPLPWNYWQLRDTRTLFDLGYDPDMPKGGKHDALQDAIRQAVGVQNIYTKLKIRPK